jgi:hypothetical protein
MWGSSPADVEQGLFPARGRARDTPRPSARTANVTSGAWRFGASCHFASVPRFDRLSTINLQFIVDQACCGQILE